MKRVCLLPITLLLASCDAGDVLSGETSTKAVVENPATGQCIISDGDIEELRNQFRSMAKLVSAGKETQRPPIEAPFVEPPTIQVAILENPTGLNYLWIVKAMDGCKKDGSFFESVEFEMTFRDNGNTTTDTANIKLKNKL